MTITYCKQANVNVSLCGELGSDPQVLGLLVGLGLDEISINPTHLLEVKAALVNGRYQDFVKHAHTITTLTRIEDICLAISAVNDN